MILNETMFYTLLISTFPLFVFLKYFKRNRKYISTIINSSFKLFQMINDYSKYIIYFFIKSNQKSFVDECK